MLNEDDIFNAQDVLKLRRASNFPHLHPFMTGLSKDQLEDAKVTFGPLPYIPKTMSLKQWGAMNDFAKFYKDHIMDISEQHKLPAQHEPGAKLDAGKPDMSLLLMFGKALHEVARVGTGGKIKYSRGGWQDVEDGINRYTAAMLRHTFQEHYEEMDPDLVAYLGEETYHAAAVAWNALARLELMMREKDNANS